MKAVKIIGIVLGGYLALVVAFESLIGVLQPTAGNTLVITTFDGDQNAGDRVLAHLESDGKTYVAANHWPRAWYERALENSDVQVVIEGQKTDRRAVPVTGEEHERVNAEHSLGLGFRFVTGFPPRYLLRLDPRKPSSSS
jgi:hypothetical protein